MLALCPNCHRTITAEAPGWDHCKFCRQEIWIPDPFNPEAPPAGRPRPASAVAGPEPPAATEGGMPIPWEQPGAGENWPKAFFQTLHRLLMQPVPHLTSVSNAPVSLRLLVFGQLTAGAGLAVNFLMQPVLLNLLKGMEKTGGPELAFFREYLANMEKMKLDGTFFLLSAALTPVFIWLTFHFTHQLFSAGHLLVLRRPPVPVNRLLRFTIYSYAPWLLLPVPAAGLIWCVVLQFRGLHKVFGFSRWAALVLVLINLLMVDFFLSAWMILHTWLRT